MSINFEEVVLKYIQNQKFQIDENYGFQLLNKLLLNRSLHEKTSNELIKKEFEDSTKIVLSDLSNKKSTEVSNYNDLDSVEDLSASIAEVSLNGYMSVEDGLCNQGALSFSRSLQKLYSLESVKGVLINVHSGGGLSDAGTLILNAISDRNKPVVVLTSFCGSAAYKCSIAADEIIAHSTDTEIGSIGVMTSINKNFLEAYKKTITDYYSEHSENKNKSFRELLKGNEKELIKNLTEADELFMNTVKKYRNLTGSENTIKETLSGKVFFAQEAKERGLIDRIGSKNKAIQSIISNMQFYK